MKNRVEITTEIAPNLFSLRLIRLWRIKQGLGFFFFIFLTLSTISAYADISTGLVGEWLSGQNSGTTLNDASGNGNSATLSSSQPTWTSSGALTFNGSNQYAGVLPTSGALLTSVSSSFTFSAWVNVNALPTNQGTSTQEGGILIRPGYHEGLYVNANGTFSANIWNSSNTAFLVTSPAYPIGSWHMVTMTVDDAAMVLTLYIDGVSVGSTTFTGTLRDYTTSSSDGYDLYMGVADPNNGGWTWYLNGSIQDVRVYNRALLSTDVAQLLSGKFITTLTTDSSTYYASPYNVNLTANIITGPQESIAKVDFYNGVSSNPIAEMTSPTSNTSTNGITINTYQYTWNLGTNPTLGNYQITAVVTDSNGNTSTSGAVNIWVTGNDLEGQWVYNQSSGSTVTDASGNGNTGTFSSPQPVWVTGIPSETGNGLNFNGNSNIVVNDSPSLDTVETNNQITVSAWIKPSVLNGSWQQIVSRGSWSLMIDGNNYLSVLNTGGNPNEGFPLTLDNQWHFVVMAYDGTTVRMYEDGVLKASFAQGPFTSVYMPIWDSGSGYKVGDTLNFSNTTTTATVSAITSTGGISSITINGAVPSNAGTIGLSGTNGNGQGAWITLNSALFIGRDQYGYSRLYNGSIEDVRIYSRAFSQSDVISLYGKTPISLSTDQLQYTSSPANAVLTATVYPAIGVTVSNVEFKSEDSNGNITDLGAGQASGNTYTLTWNNIPSGVYTITAVVTDNSPSGINTSNLATIYVNTHVLTYSVNGSNGNLSSLIYNGLQFYEGGFTNVGLYTNFYNINNNWTWASSGQGFTTSYYYTDVADCNKILPAGWQSDSPTLGNFACQQDVFGTAGQTGSYTLSRLYSTPDNQTLKTDYYITNTDPVDTMPSFSDDFYLELQTPGVWQGGWFAVGNNSPASPTAFMSGPWGSMALFTNDYVKNAYFGDVWTINNSPTYPNTTGPVSYLWSFNNCTSPGGDSSNTHCDPIVPNQTYHYASYIRFGASTDTETTLVPSSIDGKAVGDAAFRNSFPYLVNWPDRRPIARWFIGGTQCVSDADPRGWCNLDSSSQANFTASLLAETQNTINTMNAENPKPQGVIIWDLEGDTFWQSFTYVGNPPQLPNMAPEMDAAADQMFDMFKKAGYQVGMTLRPSNFEAGSTLPNSCNYNSSSGNLSDVFVLTTPTTPGSSNIFLAQGPSSYAGYLCNGPMSVTINAPGSGYKVGDGLSFGSSSVWGTVTSVDQNNGITGISLSGFPPLGAGVTTLTSTSGSGSGASISLTTIVISTPGSGYSAGDQLNFSNPAVTGWVSGTDSNGGITSISLYAKRAAGDAGTVTLTGTSGKGTGAQISLPLSSNLWIQLGYRQPGYQTVTDVDGLNLYSLAVANGGSGYNVGDELSIVLSPNPTKAREALVTVSAVNGGAITGLTITDNGQAFAYPTGSYNLSTVTGSGSGASVNLTSNYPQITLANLTSLSNYNISILANLEGKVAYAHKRWGARLFYVDSTVYHGGNFFNYQIFRQLQLDFPDVLFMPENTTNYFYGAAARYGDSNVYGDTAAPTNIWPQAFEVIQSYNSNISDLNNWPDPQLIAGIGAGNMLYTVGWYAADENTYADQMYQAATIPPDAPYSINLNSYGLTVAVNGAGIVTGSIPVTTNGLTSTNQEINCPAANCTEAYDSGTEVTLTATASNGNTFAGWSGGGCSATATTCTVTMSQAQTVTATFNTSSSSACQYGCVSGDTSPSIYDAELAAQASVGSITLTTTQQQEDEVDGTGKVDIYDAFLIAEYAVGLITTFPVGS